MFSGTIEIQTPLIQLVVRLGLAVILGGMIGLERELKNRPAGLRTNMMVSLAAATFTLIAAEMVYESRGFAGVVRIDPLRIIDAVIAGVAFLGAGAIIRGGKGIQGLTTGASLWMSGSIGVACGGGYYVIAAVATAFAVVVLYVIGVMEARIEKRTPD